ncbi:MAG: acyl-ACP--UDP-N-acetylglucosamine O-acyltransferase [Pseudomonadota bacterium]
MIDGRSIIDPSAVIGEGVSVGPWTYIGPNVELGDGVEIASHVVVKGPTKIGAGVRIYQFSTIGEDTPAFAYDGEESYLSIGSNTVIREGVTIHRGMVKGGIGRTEVGADCLLMAYVHVGHDCVLGDHVVMANNASVAGHVIVGDYANFGGYSGVAQFRSIGPYTHIAAMSLVLKDVPAYMTVGGNPASAVGLNLEGMKRRGYSDAATAAVKQAHKIIYRSGHTVAQAIEALEDLRAQYPEVENMVKTVEASEWGIIRPRAK